MEETLNLMSVLPNAFGEKYHDKGAPFLACIACARDTSKQGESLGVWIVGGGSLIAHPEVKELNDGGDMGWFPVGSECIKKVPLEFRDSNPYANKVRGV